MPPVANRSPVRRQVAVAASLLAVAVGPGYAAADTAPAAPAPTLTGFAAAAATTRLQGPDRYATAVEVSRASFPGTSFFVFVASGDDFPDALAAGPAAASLEAPLLLVPRDGVLPAVVTAELRRLQPQAIYVIGGGGAVSGVMVSQLRDLAEDGLHVAGVNRFDTAAQTAVITGRQARTVFLANGLGFADALAGSATAARVGGSLLLTLPRQLPEETAFALRVLEPSDVVLLGGEAAITEVVRQQVAAELPGVQIRRQAGATRYETAVAASAAAYPQGAERVFLATGSNFPDALAGAPAAGQRGAPLLLTGTDCAPQVTVDEVRRLGADEVVVLGGPAVVSDRAAALTAC